MSLIALHSDLDGRGYRNAPVHVESTEIVMIETIISRDTDNQARITLKNGEKLCVTECVNEVRMKADLCNQTKLV